MGDMAQRPEPFIGKAVIIAPLFGLGNPDTPQGIGGIIRWDLDMTAVVDHVPVSGASSLRDPGSAAGPQQRFQSRDQSAGRRYPGYIPAVTPMLIRFAIGDDEKGTSGKFLTHIFLQPLRRPERFRTLAQAGF